MAFDPNDPDTKAAIDKIKADADAKLDTEVTGLKSKVDELIAANKKLKKGQEIDPAEVDRLETERDELRSKLTAAEKAAKDAQKAADAAAKALEAESGFTHRLVAENGLIKALSDAGVTDPAYLEAAKAMHIGGVKIVSEGDARKALYGDKELTAAMKEWAAGDVGKKFVAAPGNSGGGALGGKGNGQNKTISSTDFHALGPKDRAAKMAEGYRLEG